MHDDMTREEFEAWCREYGFRPVGLLGYYQLPGGVCASIDNAVLCATPREQLDYLIQQCKTHLHSGGPTMPSAGVDRPKPLFSKTLRPNGKLFFLDVYQGRTGTPYLSVCENRKDKEGNFTRIRMYLDRAAIPEMRDALDEVNDFFERLEAPPAEV